VSDEIPFDLPDSWQWTRLGQIVRMSIGKTPARGDARYWTNATKPWVSISDMADYSHIKTTKEKISDAAASTLMGAISPRGSLLMSFKLTVGRTSILDIEAYHNEAIISIYPYIDEEYALRDFLFYTLPTLANMGDSKDAIKGKTLNSKSLNSLLIPLPPLKEQRHIIKRLEELYARL
jgi:type I restriction enzyme S subunit